MRKLKWTFILPIVQFAIFLTLIHWQTIEIPLLGNLGALCFAINSPGLFIYGIFLRMAPVRWLPPYVLNIRSDHFIFLVGVVVQWYFVGRELDKLKSSKSSAGAKLTSAAIVGYLLAIAWGIYLIFNAMEGILQVLHLTIESVIVLLWAAILIILSTLRLGKNFRRESEIYGTQTIPNEIRWLALTAACVSCVTGALLSDLLLFLAPSILIVGTLVQPYSPRPGKMILSLGALLLSLYVVLSLSPSAFEMVMSLRVGPSVTQELLFSMLVISVSLIACLDVKLVNWVVRLRHPSGRAAGSAPSQ
jgi:hypothetical protein